MKIHSIKDFFSISHVMDLPDLTHIKRARGLNNQTPRPFNSNATSKQSTNSVTVFSERKNWDIFYSGRNTLEAN